MKHTIILFLIAFAGFNCSSSQHYTEWSVVQLNHESGPIAPEYQYSYSITVNWNKTCEYLYTYPIGGEKKLQYQFTINNEQFDGLQEAIEKSKLIGREIPKLKDEEIPIGGSLTNAKVIIVDPDPNSDKPPKVYESPYFPSKEYKTNLESLYKFINNLVPKDIIDKADTEHKNYLNTLQDN